LIIVGSGFGEEEEEIRALALQCKENILFKEAVKQKELGNIFRKCDIFILPSFYEGMPLVVLEALASGLNVVTTDLPGLKDWIGNDIYRSGLIEYVKLPRLKNSDQPWQEDIPKFEADLKQGILSMIEFSRKRKKIVTFQNNLKSRSWENIFSKIVKLIRSELGGEI